MLRGPIFVVATARQGWHASLGALFTESVYCALAAGSYGAVVQALRNAEPEWLTAFFLTAVLPFAFQTLEYLLHWLRGTPHLRLAEFVSLAISGLSALFNWCVMRRGTLLVGDEGGSFGSDLRRLPGLIYSFLTAWPRRPSTRRKTETGLQSVSATTDLSGGVEHAFEDAPFDQFVARDLGRHRDVLSGPARRGEPTWSRDAAGRPGPG